MNEISNVGLSDNSIEDPKTMPHSIEAEQQLLGAILTNNNVYDKINNIIKSNHFFEPVHARIFELCESRIGRNSLASPVSLGTFMQSDEGLKELGGGAYLAKLAASAIAGFAARDYAQIIYELSVRRELILLGKNITARAEQVDNEENPETQITLAEQALYDLGDKSGDKNDFQSFLKVATKTIKIASEAYRREGALAGLATGFTDLDKKLGGLIQSDLIIIAGRPSMGKTALATNIAFNIAKSYKNEKLQNGEERIVDGGYVGFFSLEMSAEQLAARVLSEASEVPSEQIRRGDMTEPEFRRFAEAARKLESCPLYIDDTPALLISQLSTRARRLKREYGLDVLIVDYLQLVRVNGSRDGRVNEISEITQGLKTIAKELNIPVIALSQLSRQVENRDDKRPQLADLRESGSIEQDADVVMFVYREEYYKEREKPGDHDLEKMALWQEEMEKLHGRAEIIIGKQRHGPIGTIELSFEGRFTRFGNLVKPWQEQNHRG